MDTGLLRQLCGSCCDFQEVDLPITAILGMAMQFSPAERHWTSGRRGGCVVDVVPEEADDARAQRLNGPVVAARAGHQARRSVALTKTHMNA